MRVLFLHNNFPAQFGSLARYMSEQNHDVTFGTRWQGTPPHWLRMVRYEPHRKVGKQQHPYLAFVESAVLNGQALARVGVGPLPCRTSFDHILPILVSTVGHAPRKAARPGRATR